MKSCHNFTPRRPIPAGQKWAYNAIRRCGKYFIVLPVRIALMHGGRIKFLKHHVTEIRCM